MFYLHVCNYYQINSLNQNSLITEAFFFIHTYFEDVNHDFKM